MLVWGDVSVHKPGFAPIQLYIRFRQADLTCANRFDLAAQQNDSGLVSLEQEVFMGSFPVRGYDFKLHNGWQ
jgi:hypothetical protein